jgi:hypothetical protein
MASSSMLPPPPGQGDSPSQGSAPTTPGASAPAQGSPATDQKTQLVIGIIKGLRALAQAAPSASPGIQKINEIFQSEVMPKLMESQQPGESQAPPVG